MHHTFKTLYVLELLKAQGSRLKAYFLGPNHRCILFRISDFDIWVGGRAKRNDDVLHNNSYFVGSFCCIISFLLRISDFAIWMGGREGETTVPSELRCVCQWSARTATRQVVRY